MEFFALLGRGVVEELVSQFRLRVDSHGGAFHPAFAKGEGGSRPVVCPFAVTGLEDLQGCVVVAVPSRLRGYLRRVRVADMQFLVGLDIVVVTVLPR